MKSKNSDSSPRKRATKAVKPEEAAAKTKKTPAAAAPVAAPAAKPKVKRTVKRAATRKVKSPLPEIPPVLLEGDAPPPRSESGPGHRYALGPAPLPARMDAAVAELPESYGTGKLFLAARDPLWLYASWDFPAAQLRKYNALSAAGHLSLRVFRDNFAGEPLFQIQLHPESRHWFVPVPSAGAKYSAVLGYSDSKKKWVELARSGVTITPPDSVAADTSVRFASIPGEVPFAQLIASIKAAVQEVMPLAEALQELRVQGFPGLPLPEQIAGVWTPAQEKALAEVISLDETRRIWIGSVEVTELVRRQLEQHVSSIAAAQFGVPPSRAGELGSVSSPFGGGEKRRGFWFNINAELIIYGATEPDATVTIAGRQIKLRRDGSFSFRFALPDGHYELPAAAQSADGQETRSADLRFGRQSEYRGGVETHPQDKYLQPPGPSAVA